MGDHLVRAHHDYDATQDDELTLKVGDIVKVTNKVDDDWWEGEKIDGSGTGMFPSNFVEPVSEPQREEDSKNLEAKTQHAPKLASVEEEYVAQAPDELTLIKGGVVTVLEQNEGRWKGELNGKTGIFPAEFVKLIEEEEALGMDEDKSAKPAFKLAAYGVKQGGLGSLFAGGGMPLLKKTTRKSSDDGGAPPPAPVAKPPTITQIRQSSVEKSKSVTPPIPTVASIPATTGEAKPSLLKAIVTHHYDADNADEISLMKGEYVTILDREADEGWFKGTNERGETGLFPANFVKELEEEVPPPIRSRTRTPETRKSIVEGSNIEPSPTHTPPISKVGRPSSVVSTSRPTSVAEQTDIVTSPAHVHHPPLPVVSSPPPSKRASSVASEEGSAPPSPRPRPPTASRPRPPSMVSPDLPPLSPNQDIHGAIHHIPSFDETTESFTIEEEDQGTTTEVIEHDKPKVDPIASMAKPPKFLPKGSVPLPGFPPRPPVKDPIDDSSAPSDEAVHPRPPSRPTSVHDTGLSSPPSRPMSTSSDSNQPSMPQRRASIRTSLPPPPAEPQKPQSRASIVEDEEIEQEKVDEYEVEEEDVGMAATESIEESVDAEPQTEVHTEEQETVEETTILGEETKVTETTKEIDTDTLLEVEEDIETEKVEEIDDTLPQEDEALKKPELPELPSGPRLAQPLRPKPAKGRRAPSEQTIKEAGPSQTTVLEDDVAKAPELVEKPKPEPAARQPPVPPAKPSKPIFNKFPTPFAGVTGELPTVPLKPVQRRMFEPVPALPDKEPKASAATTSNSEDKDSAGLTAPPAGGVRSLSSRFNFASPQSSGTNEVLETKLKNFVRQEIDKLKKEFEAQLADERATRQLLEEEIRELKERLGDN